MSYVKERDVAYAKTRLGTHEVGNNCQEFSEEQYGVRCPPGGWCMSFASRCAREGGFVFGADATYGPKGFSYTGAAITWAQKYGLRRDRSWRAQPGDWIIFDWNGDGNTDHVETVIYDDGVQIITIGGNTSNQVMYRRRDRTYVDCFIALSASPQAAPVVTAQDLADIAKLIEWRKDVAATALHQGDTNGRVTILTQLLVKIGLLAKPANTYTKAVRAAVHHFKQARNLANEDGTLFGAEAAAAILTPRH